MMHPGGPIDRYCAAIMIHRDHTARDALSGERRDTDDDGGKKRHTDVDGPAKRDIDDRAAKNSNEPPVHEIGKSHFRV